uniref:Uncharacterized protein n=1 Tax=Cannabis sativa TaxID=3483 RepID=A0A803PJL6_CANSA
MRSLPLIGSVRLGTLEETVEPLGSLAQSGAARGHGWLARFGKKRVKLSFKASLSSYRCHCSNGGSASLALQSAFMESQKENSCLKLGIFFAHFKMIVIFLGVYWEI